MFGTIVPDLPGTNNSAPFSPTIYGDPPFTDPPIALPGIPLSIEPIPSLITPPKNSALGSVTVFLNAILIISCPIDLNVSASF